MDTAHAKLLLPHKLVAGVDPSIWGDGYIFTSSSTAPQTFDHAGSLRQIHIEVEEIDVLPCQKGLGQFFVLLLYPA